MPRKGLLLGFAGILAFLLLCVVNAGGYLASASGEDDQDGILLPLMLNRYNFGPAYRSVLTHRSVL
jgi:hypothetical protein